MEGQRFVPTTKSGVTEKSNSQGVGFRSPTSTLSVGVEYSPRDDGRRPLKTDTRTE